MTDLLLSVPEGPARKNARGYNTGFVLESHSHANPLLKKADFRRAGFIERALWVTAFDADEKFAAGDTPNQNPDEPGLPSRSPTTRASSTATSSSGTRSPSTT